MRSPRRTRCMRRVSASTRDSRWSNSTCGARTMAELGLLSAGAWFDPFFADERVMPLAAFFQAAGADGRLYVEVKDTDPAVTVAEAERTGLLPRVFFWSPDPARLGKLRGLSDDV